MTLEEAIKHVDGMIEWYVEGIAPENEARIREDIAAMERLKSVAQNVEERIERFKKYPQPNSLWEEKEVQRLIENLSKD